MSNIRDLCIERFHVSPSLFQYEGVLQLKRTNAISALNIFWFLRVKASVVRSKVKMEFNIAISIEWEQQLQQSTTTVTPQWVAKTIDGAVRAPMENNVYMIVFKILCIIIGLPLNLSMMWTIITRKSLHCSPRNIFVLGISFSSLAAFVQPLIEVIHFFAPSKLICQMYTSIMSLPDIFLLMNIFLSLIDRYIALEYPLWHRSKLTVKMAIGVIAAGFLVAIGLCRFVYIAQLIPLECKIVLYERTIMAWILIVLFVLCLVARVTVYFQTKRILRQSDLLAPEADHSVGCFELSFLLKKGAARTSVIGPPTIQIQLEHPRLSEETIFRLEWDATKVLVAGVTSLIVLSFPFVAFLLAMFICRTWFDALGYCNRFVWLGGYFKQFAQVHGIYHPIVFMARIKYFSIPRRSSSPDECDDV